MSFTIRYSKGDDERAIRDAREYMGEQRWAYIEKEFFSFEPNPGPIRLSLAKQWIRALYLACSLCGVRGFPVRALCRKFLAQFASKRTTDDGRLIGISGGEDGWTA